MNGQWPLLAHSCQCRCGGMLAEKDMRELNEWSVFDPKRS